MPNLAPPLSSLRELLENSSCKILAILSGELLRPGEEHLLTTTEKMPGLAISRWVLITNLGAFNIPPPREQ
jgi:hypothetical protein